MSIELRIGIIEVTAQPTVGEWVRIPVAGSHFKVRSKNGGLVELFVHHHNSVWVVSCPVSGAKMFEGDSLDSVLSTAQTRFEAIPKTTYERLGDESYEIWNTAP